VSASLSFSFFLIKQVRCGSLHVTRWCLLLALSAAADWYQQCSAPLMARHMTCSVSRASCTGRAAQLAPSAVADQHRKCSSSSTHHTHILVSCVLQDELQKLRVDAKAADKTIQRLQCQTEQKAQEAGGLNIKVRCLCMCKMMQGEVQASNVRYKI
jgi:hypothetical protein